MTRDERAALRADKPAVWVPVDPGDYLDGEVVEVASAWSDAQYDGRDPNSGFYPLLRVKVGDAGGYEPGTVLAVHAFSMVLRDRIMTQQPVTGERLIITYDGEGEKKTKGRNAPQLYRLEMPERDPRDAAKQVYSTMSPRRAPTGPPAGGPPQEPLPQGADGDDEIPF